MEAAIANLNCKDAARGTIILILIMFFKVICALLYSLPFYKAMPTGVGGGGDGVGMIVVGLLSITFTSSDTGLCFLQRSVKWSSWCVYIMDA